MMSAPDARLEYRARSAYEQGRLASASIRALPLLAVVGISLAGCAETGEVLASGGLLLLAVIGLLWLGRKWASGVVPGVAAGLLPALLPALTQAGGHFFCTRASCAVLPIVCALGGLAGGILLGMLAPRPRPGGQLSFVVACVVAALTGAVGCLLYGAIGLAVMVGGLAAGAVPLLVARRA
jgi:hypothetical protein